MMTLLHLISSLSYVVDISTIPNMYKKAFTQNSQLNFKQQDSLQCNGKDCKNVFNLTRILKKRHSCVMLGNKMIMIIIAISFFSKKFLKKLMFMHYANNAEHAYCRLLHR